MGITDSQHEKIERLVRDLGSTKKNKRETAIALLTIMGHRAVRRLHEALKDPEPRIRRSAVRVLERIGDPGSLEPLLTLVDDADSEVRSLAVRSLGLLETPDRVPRLIECYKKIPDPGGRSQILAVLLSQARRGDKGAKKFVLDRLLDGREDSDLRLRSLDIFKSLTKKESRGVTAALRKEGRKDLMERIAQLELKAPVKTTRSGLKRLASDLTSSDYFTWQQAFQSIHPGMRALPDLLLKELKDQGGDPALCQRIETALLKFGPAAVDSIHGYLEKEAGLETLESLLNLLRGFNDPRSVPYLRRCLKKLTAFLKDPSLEDITRERVLYLKAKIHNLLAALSCDSEKDDLLEMLESREAFLSLLLLQAAGGIGDQHFLMPLLDLYGKSLEADTSYAEAVKTAFLGIASRKRIKATHKMFKNLRGGDQQLLLKIFI